MVKKYEHLPDYVQRAISAKERLAKAKILAELEKPLNVKLDSLYHGKSTDNTDNYDKREINEYI